MVISAPELSRTHRSWLPLALLLLLSAAGWIATIRWAHHMGNGPGPMGLNLVSFLGFWITMMAAMMLPTLSALKIVGSGRPSDVRASAPFTAGYLTIWGLAGSLFYCASLGTETLAEHHHHVAIGVAVAIFAICAAYQTTSWKSRFLHACASPTTPRAPLTKAYRKGAHCGTRCLGTSWSVMTLLLALGIMQLAAMAVIAAALLLERRGNHRSISIVLGFCAVLYGIGVAVHPSLAPGLAAPTMTTTPIDGLS